MAIGGAETETFQRAAATLKAGDLIEAERLFKAVLGAQPKHVAALNLLGIVLTRLGRFSEAEIHFQLALEEYPNSDATLYNYGLVLKALNRPIEALQRFSQALQINPAVAETWNNRGTVYSDLNRHRDAVADFDRALAVRADYPDALFNKGNALAELKLQPQALTAYDGALALKPDLAEAWLGRGNVLTVLNQNDEACTAFDRARALRPDLAGAWLGSGNVSARTNQHERALADYDRALALNPDLAEAWLGRGNVWTEFKQYENAAAAFDTALALKPDLAKAWLGRGMVHYNLHQYEEATAAYRHCLAIGATAEAHRYYALALSEMYQYEAALEQFAKALSLQPVYSEALCDCARVLQRLGRAEEALALLGNSLELSPNYLDALLMKADLLGQQGRIGEAIAADQQVLAQNPSDPKLKNKVLHLRAFHYSDACDWTNASETATHLGEGVARAEVASPSVLARFTEDSGILLQSAIGWVQEYAACSAPFSHVRTRRTGKLRLGYVSQDFRNHVTGSGVVEMLEKHDNSRFELFGFSLASDDGSSVRKRITAAFHQFHDLSGVSDEAAARRIYDLEIDVLVELVPHTYGSRGAILAHRPAPIQINGWSAGYSAGAPFYDYVLGDQWSLPFAEQPYYLERIVHLPHTCFPYDSTQQISSRAPARSEEGLPEQGFVFCCFSASYKISRDVFRIWMSLLRQIDGSVLWLARNNDLAVANLQAAATELGIDPLRLIFAKRTPAMADHLARHRLADLFLDTVPYNAQTTAMDALWAGLPVLTCAGRSYAGRLASSQLHGIGLPELVADDLNAYERLALELTRDPERLARLKATVERNRLTCPLFDMNRLCRELEGAYATMFDIWQRGESPRSFTVDARPAAVAAS